MNIWIAVLAGFISLLIIAVAMMGFFFLLTKAVEKSVLSEEKNNNAESYLYYQCEDRAKCKLSQIY
jgi:uncharacterized protein YneF (UPF0154 family)